MCIDIYIYIYIYICADLDCAAERLRQGLVRCQLGA